MRIRRKKRYREIEPDEILIDAQNLPGFEQSRLEGRIERPIERATFRNFLLAALGIGIIFTLQLAKLQVVDAENLRARAEANHLSESVIIAERGFITDRFNEPLARNEWQPERGFSTREYPLAEAAAHVVGYVSYPKQDDNGHWFQDTSLGLAGIEAFFNDALRGSNGAEIQEETASGDVVSGSTVRTPVDGDQVTLALDAELQQALYDAIKERSDNGGFKGGSGIIMDVKTGEVYALASYPSFDPHVISTGAPQEVIAEYVQNERAPFLDRAVSGLYTPGSVVKPFVALAALEENTIAPEKSIYSSGSISIPNPYDPTQSTIFRDWKAHGWTDMREAIAVSSDVYFYAIGGGFEDQEGLGISTIEKYMLLFGLGEATGIPLEGEMEGVIPTPEWKADTFNGERWFLGNTFHTAIGQYGFQTTAIQLVRATAALANGGILVEPSILAHASGAKKTLNIDTEHINIVNEGMRQAVTTGTAQALSVPGITVAGKTGTAEVGAQKEFINSLIVGFFPYENPQYAFTIVMERADEGTLQGAPAAMRSVLEWIVENRPEMAQ